MLREYADYAPYGISIASSFLWLAQVMENTSFEEMVSFDISVDDVVAMECDTESIDRELRALMVEMYELQQRFGVEFN